MNISTPFDIGLEVAGGSMFSLQTMKKAAESPKAGMPKDSELYIRDAPPSDVGSDDSDNVLDEELAAEYDEHQHRRAMADSRHRARMVRAEHDDEEWKGFSDDLASDAEDWPGYSAAKTPQNLSG
jgi:hypothetical protein